MEDEKKKSLFNPKVDFCFKHLFGNQSDTRFLISFLNAALDLREKHMIESVVILNPNNDKESAADKYSIMDVKALTNDKMMINIEIQMRNEYNMRKRTVYYLSRMIAKRLKTAEDYQKINKTVAINILDFDLLEQTNRFHNVFRFKEVHTNIELTDVAEIHMMELPELRRYITDHREDVEREIGKNVLLDWLLFIDNPESELSKLITKRVPEIEGAMEMLYKLSQDDILREQYEAREKAMRDRLSAEAEKERRIKEAEKLGMEKGVEKGMEKGMEKVLWKIIQKKFPLITPFYYDKLIQLKSEKLDILSAELLDMKTIQDLDTFLSEES